MRRAEIISLFVVSLIGHLLRPGALAQPGVIAPPFRIFPGAVTQTEPVVAIHPSDPSVLFASAVTIDPTKGFRSEGVYLSTDGGFTWSGSDTCKGAALFNHGGDPGVAIAPDGSFILTHIGIVFNGVYSHRSTDRGLTWSAALTITGDQPEDKGTMTMDLSPSSPFFGRIYTAWVVFLNPFPVQLASSSDAAISWTSPLTVNPGPPARCSGGSIVTGGDGRVYVSWAGMTSSFPFIEDFVGFASSSDGGATWTVTQNAFDMNGISGTIPQKGGIRVNGLPRIVVDRTGGSRNDWLYILTTEILNPIAGYDPDIILRRSTDRGATWSASIRVNQDSLGSGNIQYFPAAEIDAGGGVNVIFYDDRNTTPDSAEIMLARSVNGGDTWTEFPVSSYRFKPKPISGGSSGYQGDFIDLVSSGSRLNAFWMDDVRGIYQISSAILDLGTDVVGDGNNGLIVSLILHQNYPNPFNPETVIRYSVPSAGHEGVAGAVITIRIIDLLGRERVTLVDGMKTPGEHSVRWNARNYPAGIYFCELLSGDFRQVRKLLLVK